MTKIEDDMNKIEAGIKKLKFEYDLYFGGGSKNPPDKLFNEINSLVKFYRNSTIQQTAILYRFNSISSSFATYSELWGKMLRYRNEKGVTDPRLFKTRMNADSTIENLDKSTSKTIREEKRPVIKTTKPKKEEQVAEKDEYLKNLYGEYVEGKKSSGDASIPSFDSFREKMEKQKKDIMDKHKAKDVAFRVVVENGKVTLKAKVVK